MSQTLCSFSFHKKTDLFGGENDTTVKKTIEKFGSGMGR